MSSEWLTPMPSSVRSGVIGLQRGEPRAHLVGGVHPEVQDAGGGDDGGGRVEERAQRAEHVAAGVGDPQRGVAE